MWTCICLLSSMLCLSANAGNREFLKDLAEMEHDFKSTSSKNVETRKTMRDSGFEATTPDVRCAPLPCPLPYPPGRHPCKDLVQSYYYYKGKLCPACRYCLPESKSSETVETRETRDSGFETTTPDVRCAPLPCPLPYPPGHPCKDLVQSYYYYKGKLCPACQYCLPESKTLESVETRDISNSDFNHQIETMTSDVRCLPLPCPPPYPPGHPCKELIQTYYYYEGKLCPACEYCRSKSKSKPLQSVEPRETRVTDFNQQVETTSDVRCIPLPCPPPSPGNPCKPVHTYYYNKGTLCQGCDHCLPKSKGRRMISENFLYCPAVQCETWAPPCPVQVQYQLIPIGDYLCTGCPFCPVDVSATAPASTDTQK